MIGRSLKSRFGVLGTLDADRARAILEGELSAHAEAMVRVRAEDPKMIVCLVVGADEGAVRVCRSLGLEMRPGGSGVFGLLGEDAARAFPDLSEPHRAWLAAPCAARETKVLLIAESGAALLSLHAEAGALTVTAH